MHVVACMYVYMECVYLAVHMSIMSAITARPTIFASMQKYDIICIDIPHTITRNHLYINVCKYVCMYVNARVVSECIALVCYIFWDLRHILVIVLLQNSDDQ